MNIKEDYDAKKSPKPAKKTKLPPPNLSRDNSPLTLKKYYENKNVESLQRAIENKLSHLNTLSWLKDNPWRKMFFTNEKNYNFMEFLEKQLEIQEQQFPNVKVANVHSNV